MTTFKSMIVGAAVGVLLDVVGTAAVLAALNPTAAEVATETAADPAVPPAFYGVR